MAVVHFTGTSRPTQIQYRIATLSNLFGAREPDPPHYGRPAVSEAARHLAKNMCLLRTVRRWSQETLAMHAGLDRTFVGAIERAERNLTLATAEKIANAFQLTIADLLRPHKHHQETECSSSAHCQNVESE